MILQIRHASVVEINFLPLGLKRRTVHSKPFYADGCLLDFLSECACVHAQGATHTTRDPGHEFHSTQAPFNRILNQNRQGGAGKGCCLGTIKAASADISAKI